MYVYATIINIIIITIIAIIIVMITLARGSRRASARDAIREFTKGGLVKGGLAIHAFPLCNSYTLGSVFHAQIESMPNC